MHEVLAQLPVVQRDSLSAALLLADAADFPPGYRVVGVAVLGVLRTLARAGPLVLAIDDIQWLDVSSRKVLSFAVRRLSQEPIRLLASYRTSLNGSGGHRRDRRPRPAGRADRGRSGEHRRDAADRPDQAASDVVQVHPGPAAPGHRGQPDDVSGDGQGHATTRTGTRCGRAVARARGPAAVGDRSVPRPERAMRCRCCCWPAMAQPTVSAIEAAVGGPGAAARGLAEAVTAGSPRTRR